jgi:hypothetical protein
MKKLILLYLFTFTFSTAHCAEESEIYAKLNHAADAILEIIHTDPANTQALEGPCHSINSLLKSSGLYRSETFDDRLITNEVSILNTLLNSAIRLNLEKFPYDTLRLLLDQGARPDIDDSSFLDALLNIEKTSEEGKPCPPWIESVGKFTCSWWLEHGKLQSLLITRWREKHDATSLAQEREHRRARKKAREAERIPRAEE